MRRPSAGCPAPGWPDPGTLSRARVILVGVEGERRHWDDIAATWVEWTSTPGQDPFGDEVNLPSLVGLVPDTAGLVLDVGCGEGRVARLLAARGHTVVGIDGSPNLARQALSRGLGVGVADGAALPVRDESVDLVVSCMVLMDVPDLAGHVAELSRVLRPGGTLVCAILHPVCVAGFPTGDEFSTFALGDYLAEEPMEWTSTRNDRSINYRFWRRPVSTYLTALGSAGLPVVQACEPAPTEAMVSRLPEASTWTRVPLFLHLRATKAS